VTDGVAAQAAAWCVALPAQASRRQQKNGLVAHFFLAPLCRPGFAVLVFRVLDRRFDFGVVAVANIAQPIYALVERSVADMGYELVDLERAGGGLLRVTLDIPGGARAVLIEDCTLVTRQLSHLLTVENVDYDRLEVGSPGVDRRLRRRHDFARFAGAQIDVRLHALRDGRRRLRGRLLGVDGDDGAERIRIALAPAEMAGEKKSARGTPPRQRPRGEVAAAAKDAVANEEVELALAEIETARLVPELNFKGIGRGAEK
jgi:ribosome maturation factor RimP